MFLTRETVDPRVERMRIPKRRLKYGCVVRNSMVDDDAASLGPPLRIWVDG
jgi:hypothetical protein